MRKGVSLARGHTHLQSGKGDIRTKLYLAPIHTLNSHATTSLGGRGGPGVQ